MAEREENYNDFKVDAETASDMLAVIVNDAVEFMFSEFSDDWDTAERYFSGQSDLEDEVGRSQIVKTEVRDVIRAIMPNLMRVLMQSRKPVEYSAVNMKQAAFVEQQSMWVRQVFFANGGYRALYDAILESLKLKAGPMKVGWLPEAAPRHFSVTGITAAEVAEYQAQPDIVVKEVEEHEVEENSPFKGSATLYDIECVQYFQNGRLLIEPFPMYEFFCERNAGSNLEEYVHGHRRSVTIAKAMELGLEADDLLDLDNDDPELNQAAAAVTAKKGFAPQEKMDTDTLNREILLTEAYAYFDMDGDGAVECYRFLLGGSQYKYLSHEAVDESNIVLVLHDPIPFAAIGSSITDIAKQGQDTITSLLRSMLDNAYIANNPRIAGDPTRTDFADLMNNAIGAPIKTRGSPDLKVVEVPFTAGNLLPVMDWLESDNEQRVGVTKAATGLDPDALQSTDKNAVMNTIQLSQGQVELMARNVVETGLIPLFRKLLKLATRHMDSIQLLRMKGAYIPVNIREFDPNLSAEPNVGLGTASPMQKLQTLNFIYGEQQKYMSQFGIDNPFTSLSQIYNTLEDMVELGGLVNVGRYFNYVGRNEEQVIGKQLAERAAQAAAEAAKNQPVDPSKVMMAIESGKRRIEQMEVLTKNRIEELQLQLEALKVTTNADLERDKLAQNRMIEFAKLRRDELNEVAKREQDANNADVPELTGPANGGGVQAVAAE